MPSISIPAAVVAAGAIAGGSGLIGSVISGNAAQKAAGVQAAAYQHSADLQQAAFQTTQQNLQPFIDAGKQNLDAYTNYYQGTQNYLQPAVDEAHAAIPGPMTEQTIKSTPGYQFMYDQGLKAMNNSQAAKGLGASGTAMKQNASWASGLANQSYQNQFNMQQTRFTDSVQNLQNRLSTNSQIFNQLGAPVAMGANVGSALGGLSANVNNAIGQSYVGAGQALGAGIAAQGNALAGGISNLGQTAGNTLMGYAESPYIMRALNSPYNPYANFGPAGLGSYASAMGYNSPAGTLNGNPLY